MPSNQEKEMMIDYEPYSDQSGRTFAIVLAFVLALGALVSASGVCNLESGQIRSTTVVGVTGTP